MPSISFTVFWEIFTLPRTSSAVLAARRVGRAAYRTSTYPGDTVSKIPVGDFRSPGLRQLWSFCLQKHWRLDDGVRIVRTDYLDQRGRRIGGVDRSPDRPTLLRPPAAKRLVDSDEPRAHLGSTLSVRSLHLQQRAMRIKFHEIVHEAMAVANVCDVVRVAAGS